MPSIFCCYQRIAFAILCAALACSLAHAEKATEDGSFRDLLKLAGVEPEMLVQIPHDGQPTEADWKTLLKVLYRLRQIQGEDALLHDAGPTATPDLWLTNPQDYLGKLVDVSGTAIACERLPLPARMAEMHEVPAIYRCQFRFPKSDVTGIVFTRQRPARWEASETLNEPIRFRGVILKLADQALSHAVLLLADHLKWFPTQGAPAGQLLLARHGMDAALFDEVRHHRRFVEAKVSREGEAFYAGLATIQKVQQDELLRTAQRSVRESAEKWQSIQKEISEQTSALRRQIADSTQTQQKAELRKRLKQTQQRSALAAAVLERAEVGRSSAAPLFLQPEQETGSLVLIEGIARRAVKISVEAARGSESELKAYYEIEIFTPHSRKLHHLPVVCCVAQLPAGFPEGDKIREPVRLAGVFFKSWLYAARQQADRHGGDTTDAVARQQRVFAPIILGKEPVWLPSGTASRQNSWGIWGGVAFLVVLAIMWVVIARLARGDRLARKLAAGAVQVPKSPWEETKRDADE